MIMGYTWLEHAEILRTASVVKQETTINMKGEKWLSGRVTVRDSSTIRMSITQMRSKSSDKPYIQIDTDAQLEGDC